jgi:hypothetical protein
MSQRTKWNYNAKPVGFGEDLRLPGAPSSANGSRNMSFRSYGSQRSVKPMRATTPKRRPETVESFSMGRMKVPRIGNNQTPRALSPRNAT